jgi:hypothetical protein
MHWTLTFARIFFKKNSVFLDALVEEVMGQVLKDVVLLEGVAA